MIRGFQSQTFKQYRVSELCLQSHFSWHFISSDTGITCTLVFLQSDPCLFGAWLHEQLFDIYFIFLLYHTYFNPYCEDKVINFFTGFLKMFFTVLSTSNTRLCIFLWIKRSIYTYFTNERVILRATRKTFKMFGDTKGFTVICHIAFSCSSAGSGLLHSPLLSGTWKNVSYT